MLNPLSGLSGLFGKQPKPKPKAKQKYVKIIFVHGFGGEDKTGKTQKMIQNRLQDLGLDNCITAVTYAWDSIHYSFLNIKNDWGRAKENAEKEMEPFLKSLKKETDDSRQQVYIIAFSLGTRIAAHAINKLNPFPRNLKGIFFWGSALTESFRLNQSVPIKILNYYSKNSDLVLNRLYRFIEPNHPGGSYGFYEIAGFVNHHTNASHAVPYFDYKKRLIRPTMQIIAFWEGLKDLPEISEYDIAEEKKDRQKMDKILESDQKAVYCDYLPIKKRRYYFSDLRQDASKVYFYKENPHSLTILLNHLKMSRENVLNDFRMQKGETLTEEKQKFFREKALQLRFHSSLKPENSVFLKLIYQIPVKLQDNFSGNRFLKAVNEINTTNYFSKMNFETNVIFQNNDVKQKFIWHQGEKNLPLIYKIDKNLIRHREVIRVKPDSSSSDFAFIMEDLDIVLLNNKAYVGFSLRASSVKVENYLKLVSPKLFGKWLVGENAHISGLLRFLQTALQEGVEDEDLLINKETGEQPFLMQLLMIEESFQEEREILKELIHLAGTFSQPKPKYPKIKPKVWEHSSALDSLFAACDYGITQLCYGENEFNAIHKWQIFFQAYYFLWILSQEFSDSQAEKFSKTLTEGLRRDFFEKTKKGC
jgi:pimeloyl-ACP methyl ester carboxylesterase